ncbi:hypothetical protein ACH9D2_02665 [Kocuria sp. M4R2S49]|uniref:hypothetical protein n=1 Tax=Kocuria rhizosphaericola TaxID=3376284 RepID=UPI0037AE2DCE
MLLHSVLAAALLGRAARVVSPLTDAELFPRAARPTSVVLALRRNSGARLGLVLDEWSGVEGTVTLEDVLEELVRQVRDDSHKLRTA